MNPTQIKSPTNGYIGILFIIAIFWSLLVFGTRTIFSGFHLIDDSLYLSYKSEIDKLGFGQTFMRVLREDLSIRFRPLTILYYVSVAFLFNYSYAFIAMLNVVITIISSFVLFRFAKKIGLSTFLALLFVLILYTGNQGSISYWIATNENLGMFFLSFALLFGAKSYYAVRGKWSWQILEILFFIFSALSKESFLLLAPAIVFGRYVAESPFYKFSFIKFLRTNALYIATYVLVTAIILYFIVFVVGINSLHYAGIDEESFSLRNLGHATLRLVFTKGYGIPLLIPVALYFFRKHDLDEAQRKYFALLFILYWLVTLPQIVLYAKTEIFMRYLLPGLLGGAVAVVFALKLFRNKFHGIILRQLFYGIVLLVFLGNMVLMVKGATIFAEEGRIVQELLNSVRTKTGPRDSILIIGDPVTQSEPVQSLAKFLASPLADRPNVYMRGFVKDIAQLSALDKEILNDFEKTTGVRAPSNQNPQCIVLFPVTRNSTLPKLDLENYTATEVGTFTVYNKK